MEKLSQPVISQSEHMLYQLQKQVIYNKVTIIALTINYSTSLFYSKLDNLSTESHRCTLQSGLTLITSCFDVSPC